MILEAKLFATEAHKGQVRKTTGKDYITHPIAVAAVIEKAGLSVEAIIAAFLHDVVEDTTKTIEDIQEKFGDKVASLVAFNTEDKSLSWEERKQHTVDSLVNATLEQKALVVADKWINLSELIEDYKTYGEDLWKSFKRGKDQQKWYFSNVLISAKKNLKDEEIPHFFKEYEEALSFFN
jgi:(p)ppGpp synthase/HD superfamily hydrolase